MTTKLEEVKKALQVALHPPLGTRDCEVLARVALDAAAKWDAAQDQISDGMDKALSDELAHGTKTIMGREG